MRQWFVRGWVLGALLGALVLGGIRAAGAAEPAPEPVLRHAVICPLFKGDPHLAELYHRETVRILKELGGFEYYEPARSLRKRVPEFSFRVNGSIETNEDGRPFVVVTLVDQARKEQIASLVAPAATDPAVLNGWRQKIRADFSRRAAKLPFECRVYRKAGQGSVTLDRGLGSGLLPGMVLLVSEDEEPLISPMTGEVVGRDSPRALGKIQVFRVVDNAAYARPVLDTKLPLFKKLYARTF